MAAPAILRLLRWPGILTAATDAACASALFFCTPAKTFSVAAAAGLLYAGGVVLNDAADARRDATLHPDRPLPRGEVPPRAAWRFGLALLASGIWVSLPAGRSSFLAFSGVAAAVLLYDLLLKRWGPAGVLGMGLCRGGSVLAAALSSPAFAERLGAAPLAALILPLPWLLQGGAVTSASLLEETRRGWLVPVAAAGILLPSALAFPLLAVPGNPHAAWAIAPVALFTFGLGRALARTARAAVPAAAGAVVREGVLGFLLLDSAVLLLRGFPLPGASAVILWIGLRAALAGRRS